jgi:hypothetical protein
MRTQIAWGHWVWPLAALAIGTVLFGLSAAKGHGLELIWLPAVLLAAAWPDDRKRTLTDCLRWRRGRRRESA